jgi:hypothetical protein
MVIGTPFCFVAVWRTRKRHWDDPLLLNEPPNNSIDRRQAERRNRARNDLEHLNGA